MRNVVHVILLSLAVASLAGAVIGSLDSCNDTIENVTVSRIVTSQVTRSVNVTRNTTFYRNITNNVTIKEITPLSTFLLVDASGSMSWAESGQNGGYININTNAQGVNDNTTQFTCKNGDKNLCWPTPTFATIDSWSYDINAQGDRFDKAKLAFDEILYRLDIALNNETSNNLRTGILQWAKDDHGVVLESHFTNNTNLTRESNRNMVINGDLNTCWAPGLCQCYAQMKNDPESVGSSKMCVLMTDGGLCVLSLSLSLSLSLPLSLFFHLSYLPNNLPLQKISKSRV